MRVASLLMALHALTSTAHAATVPKAGSASASTLTLPSGPGSTRGLADLGAIDVFSSQVQHSAPLPLPPGRGGARTACALAYSGALGNGPHLIARRHEYGAAEDGLSATGVEAAGGMGLTPTQVEGMGYTPLNELRRGDRLGCWPECVAYASHPADIGRVAEVFNLEVDQAQSYFVAIGRSLSHGILVHNGGQCFSTAKPTHVAELVQERAGQVISKVTITSGNMTAEEAALGFPRSSLATQTEARAVAQTGLEAGDTLAISGTYRPCPSCKGKMNNAAAETGAKNIYRWQDLTWSTGQK